MPITGVPRYASARPFRTLYYATAKPTGDALTHTGRAVCLASAARAAFKQVRDGKAASAVVYDEWNTQVARISRRSSTSSRFAGQVLYEGPADALIPRTPRSRS